MREIDKCSQLKQLTTLADLRDRARMEKRGFEIDERNLEFHSLPEFMTEIIQNGGSVLIDIGGNVFITNWHDKK